jgi:uncharacterized membrane protein
MLSKARIGSHPLHPMLIAIPITSYLATLASLVALGVTRDAFWFRVALWANMVGVVSALVAAIPGAIDLLTVVPRRTVARKTGVFHALTNVAALALFAINLYLMADAYRDADTYNRSIGLVLTGGGVLLTMIAGWFGWEMVQRHHVGVLDRPDAYAVDDPDAVAARVAGQSSRAMPVTDSQVLAAEEAPTGRWPRDDAGATESGRITRH